MKEISKGIVSETFDIFPFHLDCHKRFPLSRLIRRMIFTAGLHSDYYGFGIGTLQSKQLSWVLHKLSIHFTKSIDIKNTQFEIVSYVSTIEDYKTHRDFLVFQDDALIATSTSSWVAIDMESRRPTRLTNLLPKDYLVRSPYEFVFPTLDWKSIIKGDRVTNKHQHVVVYSDLDINNHVNSEKWVEHALNILPTQSLPFTKLSRVRMYFKAEARLNDHLKVEHSTFTNDTKIDIVTMNNASTGKACFEIEFVNR